MADSKSVTVEPSSPFVLRSPVKATRPRAFYRLGTTLVDWLTQAKRAVGACVWHSHTQIAASLRTDTSEVFFFFLIPWVSYFTSLLYTQCLFSRLQGRARGVSYRCSVSPVDTIFEWRSGRAVVVVPV